MLDAHCHLDLQDGDPIQIWEQARSQGLSQAILAGVDPQGWLDQEAICSARPGLYRTAGLHPWFVADSSPEALAHSLDTLESELSRDDPRRVGLGELGLDRSSSLQRRTGIQLDLQLRAFRAQLNLARAHALPLVLHIVAAHGLALDVVAEHGVGNAGGMIHSFSGSAESCRRWLKMGLYISISPSILRGSKKLAEAVRSVPLDRLLVETDSPDQCATPAQLDRVIAAVAQQRGEPIDQVATETARNARRLFDLASIA